MSADSKKEHMTATEWMDFYEKLFREENPVKGSPAPLGDIDMNIETKGGQ